MPVSRGSCQYLEAHASIRQLSHASIRQLSHASIRHLSYPSLVMTGYPRLRAHLHRLLLDIARCREDHFKAFLWNHKSSYKPEWDILGSMAHSL